MSSEQTISVSGMSCTGCEATVEEALEEIGGVDGVDADHEADSVTLHLSETVPDEDIEQTVSDAGYSVDA